METKDINEMVLLNDGPGDEKRVRSILTDWGMDKSAIGRMLDEHRETQARVHQVSKEQLGKVCPTVVSHVSHATPGSPISNSRRQNCLNGKEPQSYA